MSRPILGCPIDYYERNLFFNSDNSKLNKNCWAAYKLGGFNYDFQNRDTKDAILLSLVHTIKNVSHAKIMTIPTTEDVELHYSRFKKKLRPKSALYKAAVHCADSACDYLKQSGESWNDYTTYLFVKLQEEAVDQIDLIGKQMREFFKAPLYGVMSLMLLAPEDITTVTFKRFEKIEEKVYQTLSGCVELHRLQARDMQWLLKRVGYKDLKTSFKLNKTVVNVTDESTGKIRREYSEDWQPYCERGKKAKVEYFRPHKADIQHLFSGQLKREGNKGISVTHDSGEVSYQSYLVFTNVPEAIIFPGREWTLRLLKQPIPVELCIDIENVHYQKALDDLGKIRTELNSQIKDIEDAGESIPTKLFEAHEQIESLCRELGDNRLPMSKTTISICIAGSDPEQVEKDILAVKQHLDKSEFTVERSGADQMQLFMQHIPGTETYTRDFIKRLSPFPIAGGIFGVNNRVGDNVGFYIGMANGKPVFFNPTQACLENKSPAGTLYGDLGYGKSFNANLIVFQHVLNGGRAIVIDPKGERASGVKHWRNMPVLGTYTNVVELTGEAKNRGLLDPYIMFPNNLDHAADLARTSLMKLLNVKSGTPADTLLKECVNKVKTTTNPCMMKVVDCIGNIDSSDEYKDTASSMFRNLQATMDNGLSQLLFGSGTEQAINVNSPLNVISFKGMTFPDVDKHEEDYNDDEKLSSVLTYLAVDFTKQFAWLYPHEPKLVLIDESWFITAIQIGRELIKALARLGRSLFLSTLLNGHSVLDLPGDELRATITYKFCFHTNDEREAERMLEYLKLDKTKENINILVAKERDGGLGNGECLFSDLYGRVSRLKFDAVFSTLIEFFKTTPTEENEKETIPVVQKKSQKVEQKPEPIKIQSIEQEESQGDTFDVRTSVDEILKKYGKISA